MTPKITSMTGHRQLRGLPGWPQIVLFGAAIKPSQRTETGAHGTDTCAPSADQRQ
jgi:hypothetical protein